MSWQFNSTEAVFLQIADRLRRDIVNGLYTPDQQFPSVRQLAEITAVNPNTVQKALTHLEEEGLLHTNGTIGRFVTEDVSVIQQAKENLIRRTVRAWIDQARALNITEHEMIKYIQEEVSES